MPFRRLPRRYSRAFVVALAIRGGSSALAQLPAHTFLIRNVRIFDGTRTLPANSVLVERDTIRRLGVDLVPPPGIAVIDGSGKTVMPGLIDAHTHTSVLAQLRQALLFGVTTELGMDDPPAFIAAMKAAEARGENRDAADVRSAGWVATVPHGHGTEFGSPNPTLTRPEEAAAFVAARVAEGSDYIKIIVEDGSATGQPLPTLDGPTVAALAREAHANGKLAVAHITTYRDALAVLDEGVDGLAHVFVDREPDPDFGQRVARHHAFVIPTLTVQETLAGSASGVSLAEDADIAPYLSPDAARNLRALFTAVYDPTSLKLDYSLDAVQQLVAARVPVLAGTDAPNPGTWYGASMHRELELLVRGGMTPAQALAAATSVPAAVFHLDDRGEIAPGRRADLVMVRGDPTNNILATRAIVGIWQLGTPLDRRATLDSWIAGFTEHAKTLIPAGSDSGVVSTFDDSTMRVGFGRGWRPSGGTREPAVRLALVRGGATGTPFALKVSGSIAASDPSAMPGAVFYPEEPDRPVAQANLSAHQGITFWTKGDGGTYRVVLWTTSYPPISQSFVAGPEWRQISFPFSAFHGSDGFGVVSIVFAAGSRPGPFEFQIDEVKLK
jgi:imidazolonepropionase-like amidohydrolase